MSDHTDWEALRNRRMAEPGAAEVYEAARLAEEARSSAQGGCDEPPLPERLSDDA